MIQSDFHKLEESGVDYCVLRKWEILWNEGFDDDIDIMIPAAQKERAETVLRECGYKPKRGGTTRHTFYKKYLPSTEQLVSLDVAWNGPGYNGLPLVNWEHMVAHRQKKNGIWIPSEEDLFIQLLFHTILNKNGFAGKEGYRQQLLELRTSVEKQIVRRQAKELFGRLGVKVVNIALEGNLSKTESYKWHLVIANLLQRPAVLPTLIYNLLFFHQILNPLRRLNRRYNPFSRQPTVVILGPDGSGKTTTAKNVQEFLKENGISTTYTRLGVYNESSIVMDTLKRVRNTLVGHDSTETKEARTRGEMELGKRNGQVKAMIHSVDILVRLFRAHTSGDEVIVADRYLQDIYIFDEPGVAEYVVRLLEGDRLYVYVLHAETETIASRSEYTAVSIDRMRERLKEVDGERIDVSQSPEETKQSLLTHLLTKSDFLSRLV